jgi:TolB protein
LLTVRIKLGLLVGLLFLAMPVSLLGQARVYYDAYGAESGVKIAFTSNRDGNSEIYLMNVDGSSQKRLTNNPAGDFHPDLSSSGSKIVFTSLRDGPYWVLYSMSADGSGQTRLTSTAYNSGLASWSPDGSKLAFMSDRDGNEEIYVMDADGTDPVRVTNNPAVDRLAAWFTDGTRIAFSSNRDGDYEIYTANADGSGLKKLTSNSVLDASPTWSPDGSKIAFAREGGSASQIYVMNAEGSNKVNISNNAFSDYTPDWSTDASKIVFVSTRDGNHEIYSMNADGSGQTRLTSNPSSDAYPSVGGSMIAGGGERLEVEVRQFKVTSSKFVYFVISANQAGQSGSIVPSNPDNYINSVKGKMQVGPVHVTNKPPKYPITFEISAYDSFDNLLNSKKVRIESPSDLPKTFANSDKTAIDFRGSIRALPKDPLDTQGSPANDPLLSEQWYWYQANVNKVLMRYGYGSFDPVTVAVIDSGVDYKHKDLSQNMWRNMAELNGVAGKDDDKNGVVDDRFGTDCVKLSLVLGGVCVNDSDGPLDNPNEPHGTLVAGIIGAKSNNAIGIAGSAPNAKIMAIKVIPNGGKASIPSIAAGIDYAVKNGAKVINLSMGHYYPLFDDALESSIANANSKGVIIIAAAGNEQTSNPSTPAAYTNVIGVSSLSRIWNANLVGDTLFLDNVRSNYGTYVDMSAPGTRMVTTKPGSQYYELANSPSGTSLSAPLVSACAAVIQGYAHDKTGSYLTVEQLRKIIFDSAVDLGPPGWDSYYGQGMVDIEKAIEMTDQLIGT